MSLWLHYEDTGFDLVKLIFSSAQHDKYIRWKQDKPELDGYLSLLKQIPTNLRTYDAVTHIWTVQQKKFDTLATIYFNGKLVQHASLLDFLNGTEGKSNSGAWHDVKSTEKPEDFFHAQSPVAVLPTKAIVEQQLVVLLGTGDINRKSYLLAAKRLHPDLGGDAKKMSELNQLWKQYQELV